MEQIMRGVKYAKIEDLPKIPPSNGVYFLCNRRGKPLYIGKAVSLRTRIRSHFKNPSWRLEKGLSDIKKIGFIATLSEIESLILESAMIKKYQPEMNILQKDDKQFFYVGVTNEIYPKVFITHQPKIKILNSKHEILNKSQIQNYKSKTVWNLKNCDLNIVSNLGFEISDFRYVGPFTDGKSLKLTLKLLRRAFPYYTKNHGKLPCFYCHLDLCPGINPDPKEYKKNIRKMMETLTGKNTKVLRGLKKEMRHSAKSRDYEKAAKIRDQIRNLERVFKHGAINKFKMQNEKFKIIDDETIQIAKRKIVLAKLKKYLGLNRTPYRIEAYDISNIQGVFAVGSMITFVDGQPDKNSYRRFKIKTVDGSNDVAMIKEILMRRLNHSEWQYPDLILIDGGIAQLNVALKIKNPSYATPSSKDTEVHSKASEGKQISKIKNNVQIVSLAKRENLLYVEGQSAPIPLKNLPPEISNILLRLRDEAHRFAVNYYRKSHRKYLIKRVKLGE